jgi:non-specific serine/threonine protein kinase
MHDLTMADPDRSRSGSLPSPHTRFVGRSRELSEIRRLLASNRLLTLTGPGGCGKTRLALQVAHELAAGFDDDVGWCDLAALSDPADVPQVIAAALNIREYSDRSLLESLQDALQSRHTLIVLDNCEHVLTACASLAGVLLQACPHVTLVTTSLQPLGLPQETVWLVPPMSLPEAPAAIDAAALATLNESDAIRLFIDRACEVFSPFDLTASNAATIVAICHRLDGLPLPIELAAARVKMLTVEQIAARLDDAFRLLTRGGTGVLPRHQTLRATLDWTYQFLDDVEQALLRRLSIFAGSFTLEMAEAICRDAIELPSILDRLASLVDKSFVMLLPRDAQRAARYRLLEPIRQYARERLEVAHEAADLHVRHLTWCLALAEGPAKSGPDQAAWLARLELDQDNLRAALMWARASGDAEQGLRLASGLWTYWLSRGRFTEGRRWLEELLAIDASLVDGRASAATRARALFHASALALRQGDFAHAGRLAEASLQLQRALDDKVGISSALNVLAIGATERGEYDRAMQLHEEALALRRTLGDLTGVSSSLINLGVIARRRGDYGRAVALYDEALSIKRQSGDKVNAALALSNLSEIAVFQGNYARAVALAEESLALYRQIDNRNGEAVALNNLAAALRQQGDLARAEMLVTQSIDLLTTLGETARAALGRTNLGDIARDRGELDQAWDIYQACLAIFRETGDQWSAALTLHALGSIASAQNDDPRAEVLYRESLDLYRAVRYRLGMVEALEAMAEVRAQRGDAARAARWMAVCEAQRSSMSAPVLATDRPHYAEAVRRARAALGDSAWTFTRMQARDLTLEQAVTEALSEEAPATSAVAAPKPDLQIYALGATRVIAGDRTLTSADWTYTKSKEMLFYLLIQPPVTKEQIGLDLWPDASEHQLRNIFHRAVHYLRQALGRPDWIVFAGGLYTFNRELPYWCDVPVFDDHVKQAHAIGRLEAMPSSTHRARAIDHLTAAVQLWRGDFLEDLDAGEWAIFKREELRRNYIQALIDLGALHFAEAQYDRAAAVYRRLLALDTYLELAHRELMRCFVRQGEVGHALQHYQHLRDTLRRELQAEPSPETVMLYERLKRGEQV